MKRRIKTGRLRTLGFSLNILTDSEAEEIHIASLELLKETGVFVESEEAIAIYDGSGCIVDRKEKVVRFPPLGG